MLVLHKLIADAVVFLYILYIGSKGTARRGRLCEKKKG